MTQLPSSCQSDYDPNSLPVDIAYQKIFDHISPSRQSETVTLLQAQNRILATDVLSPVNVPNHNNSAMDGYAIQYKNIAEYDHTTSLTLTVSGKSLAGHPYSGKVNLGECVRITTGAIIPNDCDTIIIQEDVQTNDDDSSVNTISIKPELLSKQKCGQHVRYAGESLNKGDIALKKGSKLSASEIGLLASLGIDEVAVMVKPKVAILTTGDEIRALGSAIKHGEVYDSNRYTLMAMLSDLQCDVIDFGIIPDEEEATKSSLKKASELADIIIATGGASVGEADYVRHVFKALGDVSFWKLAMRPGRPLSFGRINDAIFFGLPGNPVSVMVTFYQFVKPGIQHWLGQPINHSNVTGHHRFKVKSTSALKKRPGRIEYQRGILYRDEYDELCVKATGDQGSGILSSMTQANCFIVLENDCTGVKENELVNVEPFNGVF